MSSNINLDRERAIREILERISNGESLRSILPKIDREEYLPSLSTFLLWVSEDKALSEHYARAMELRSHHLFEELFEIADDATNDFMRNKKTGEYDFQAEAVQRSRVRIDTRKWALSKMNPKKYGDKLELSGDAENPIQINQKIDLSVYDDAELRTLAELQRKGGTGTTEPA